MELESYNNLFRLASVLNGGVAGLCGVLATFPIDLSKTRLQNQSNQSGQKMYKGMIDCVKQVVQREGFFGLYRGALPNLVLIIPEKTIKLTMNDLLRRHLSKDGKTITFRNQVLAGAGAGFCQVIVTSPMEMMKIYGQDAGRINAISSTGGLRRNSFKVVYGRHGLTGFYKGATATLMRDVPFSVIYFPLVAALTNRATKDGSTHPPFLVTLICGVLSGGIAAAAVNPVDVVKTRLQSIHRGTEKYSGVINCFRTVYRREGLRSFYRGVGPRVVAIAPLFGIAQSVYFLGVGESLLGIPQLRPV